MAIPDEIRKRIGNIEITADLLFVNKIPFLITLGKRVKFTTIANIPNRQAATLLTGLDAVENIYKQCGYNISTMYMDNEFEPLNNKLKG